MPGTISGERIDYGYQERNPRRASERLPKTRRPAWTKRLLQQLSKALIERGLDGEMTHHLGYEKHSPEGKNSVFLRQNGIGAFLWRRDAVLPKEHDTESYAPGSKALQKSIWSFT
jgi:hypothetical protein